jgi:intracellular multiplication protein IcmP
VNDRGAPDQGSDIPGFVVALIALAVLAVLTWLLAHAAMVSLWLWVKSGEIAAIRFFDFPDPGRFRHLAHALATVRVEHLQARVRLATVSAVNQRIGRYIGPVCALPILIFALIVFRARQKRLRGFTTEEVVEAIQERYPWGRYWNLNIHAMDPHSGPFALALRPWDLARQLDAARWEPEGGDHLGLRPERFAAYYTEQMGSDDLRHLHPAVTALVTAILPQVTGDGKTTYARLAHLTRRATDDRKDPLRGVREMTAKDVPWKQTEEESAVWREISGMHHYARGQVLALVARARENGLLPPVWMLWLKGVDRDLYYALQSLGNGGGMAFVEGAGILAHYRAEKAAGRALVAPEIEDAVAGIEAALKQVRG